MAGIVYFTIFAASKRIMALFLTKDLDDPARSRIGVWQISESEAELRAMTSIPSDELEEISYIRSESLRKQKLAVRALLDAMFEDKVYLSHHDNGKPYIENNSINISITHTDKYVAVILDEDKEVGIDCESLDRDFSAVEKKALSEDEIDDIKKSLLTDENYKSCSIEKHNQNTYLNFYVKTESDNKTVYANQCNTVVDGKLYIITLQGSNGKKITADNKGLMESILDSVTITPSNFFTENMDIIIYVLSIVLFLPSLNKPIENRLIILCK